MRKKFLASLLIVVGLMLPAMISAQVKVGEFGSTFGMGTADLESTIIKIVQWVLGFLGLIAVLMIIYGGFVLLTAGGGNEQKAESSKKIIIAAVIGLLIILLAWAIVTFVVKTTNSVTQ